MSADGVLFNKNQSEIIVYLANKTDTSYQIPKSVVTIKEAAFWGCSKLNSILIPSSVTVIENSAFNRCYSLSEIIIPDSVEIIGEFAFYGTSITETNIPKSVTSIGGTLSGNVFNGCTKLTAINADPANNYFTSVDNVLFSKDKKTLVRFPTGRGGKYIIPVGVLNIGYQSFSTCTNLTEITIPASVTSIGSSAFVSCGQLQSAYFEHLDASDIESFGNFVFNYAAADFKIIYPYNAVGFTTPKWNGYPAYPDEPEWSVIKDISKEAKDAGYSLEIEAGNDEDDKKYLTAPSRTSIEEALETLTAGLGLDRVLEDMGGDSAIVILNVNGEDVTEKPNTNISTGMTIAVKDGGTVINLDIDVIIVKGDVTGRGEVDETDFKTLLEYISNGRIIDTEGFNNPLKNHEEIFEKAGNVTDGARIDIEDLMYIRQSMENKK
jgi:hypothetical protein